jgi:asparagine synthase (glutamine-hydrolysing)
VSKLARRNVTVALSGDGGDELFGGYETYRAELLGDRYNKVPRWVRRVGIDPLVLGLRPRRAKKGLVNKARRFVEGFNRDPALGHARWRRFMDDAEGEALFTPEAQAEMEVPADHHIHDLFIRAGPRNRIDQLLYVDLKSYLAENCLVKVDRMSMACSLEARVPLLDHEMVELAFRLPAHLKVTRSETKPLLKALAAQRVPPECVYRPKEGFSIPIKEWLRTSLTPLVSDLLRPSTIERQGLFRVEAVERLVAEHLSRRENHSHLIWSLMVFQDWKRRWGV